MSEVECREDGCSWDTRGTSAGAGTCPDMRQDACLLSMVCSARFNDDDCGHQMDAALADYAADIPAEPTPKWPHTEEYRRAGRRTR